jgi:hypothetical protein
MSTLKTTYLQHPSAGSPNITLASTGAVALNGTVTGSGMDLINTTTFSAASSVSVNNVFTNTYANYRIVISALQSVSASGITLRLRAGGSDTTTNYYYSFVYNVGVNTWVGSNGTGSMGNALGAGTTPSGSSIDIYSPQRSEITTSLASYLAQYGAMAPTVAFSGGTQLSSTQFDGFTLIPGSGTISGTVRVYGYHN